MGQAKNRGSFEDRKTQAIERDRAINEALIAERKKRQAETDALNDKHHGNKQTMTYGGMLGALPLLALGMMGGYRGPSRKGFR